jgi:hypothetical protein
MNEPAILSKHMSDFNRDQEIKNRITELEDVLNKYELP